MSMLYQHRVGVSIQFAAIMYRLQICWSANVSNDPDLLINKCWACAMPFNLQLPKSVKNTRISRISNSITHLQSYTNSAIARNCVTGVDIAMPSAGIIASSADVSHWMASVSWCFASGSQCFTCFTMFS